MYEKVDEREAIRAFEEEPVPIRSGVVAGRGSGVATGRICVLWAPHLTRRIFSLIHTHMLGSSRVFVVRASCVILMCLF